MSKTNYYAKLIHASLTSKWHGTKGSLNASLPKRVPWFLGNWKTPRATGARDSDLKNLCHMPFKVASPGRLHIAFWPDYQNQLHISDCLLLFISNLFIYLFFWHFDIPSHCCFFFFFFLHAWEGCQSIIYVWVVTIFWVSNWFLVWIDSLGILISLSSTYDKKLKMLLKDAL